MWENSHIHTQEPRVEKTMIYHVWKKMEFNTFIFRPDKPMSNFTQSYEKLMSDFVIKNLCLFP